MRSPESYARDERTGPLDEVMRERYGRQRRWSRLPPKERNEVLREAVVRAASLDPNAQMWRRFGCLQNDATKMMWKQAYHRRKARRKTG